MNSWFVGSNTVEEAGFLTAIIIRSTTSFGGDVKLSGPCGKILRHVKDHCKYERDTLYAKFAAISCQVSSALLPDFSAGIRNDQNFDGDAQ
jgi:hypothetical protein